AWIPAKAVPADSPRRRPASVRRRRRPSRWNRATPSSSSSSRTWRLTAPWVTCSSAAARDRLPRRAAASKARRALRGGRSRWLIREFSSQGTQILSIFRAGHVRYRTKQDSPGNASMSANPVPQDFHAWPDASGHFGRHGGRFVAETLMGPLEELAAAYDE